MDSQKLTFAFALAQQLQDYLHEDPAKFDDDTWDNLSYWRSGILSQGLVTEADLSELLGYLEADVVTKLVERASANVVSQNNNAS